MAIRDKQVTRDLQTRSHDHYRRDAKRGYKSRNVVKGLDGGIRGADYEELVEQHLEKKQGASARNRRAADRQNLTESLRSMASQTASASGSAAATASEDAAPVTSTQPAVVDAIIAADAAAAVNIDVAQVQQDHRSIEAKLDDEKKKKKLLLQDPDEEDEEDLDEEDIDWVDPLVDAEVDELLQSCDNEQIFRLVQDPEVEMRIYGTIRLVDAADMRASLGTPLRIARHLRILATRLLDEKQFQRRDIVAFISRCFLKLGVEFGGSALRSFVFGVGIGRIYPLEIFEHIAKTDPSFLPNTRLGEFLPSGSTLELTAGKITTLECDPELKIIDFALKGGGEPGYQFAPRQEPGKFAFCVLTPGHYRLLLNGVDDQGKQRIQEIKLRVLDATGQPLEEEPDQPEEEDYLAGIAAIEEALGIMPSATQELHPQAVEASDQLESPKKRRKKTRKRKKSKQKLEQAKTLLAQTAKPPKSTRGKKAPASPKIDPAQNADPETDAKK